MTLFPAGMQYSGNIRWVFPQRCNVPRIQGTFREHIKEKHFLTNSWWKNCFCVKSVWFDDEKCWSCGKFQQSQSNVSRIFEEHSTNFYFKNIPRISPQYCNVMKKFLWSQTFCGLSCEIFNIGSLLSWKIFLKFIETVFHWEQWA